MRRDMNKLLCERPRWGWRLKTKRCSKHARDWESEPGRGRMPGRQRQTKGLNENLQPLRRFLLRRVGQQWDRVYSEIRADLKVTRAIDLHILQHLEDMVARDVRYEGRVPTARRHGSWEPIRGTRWDEFYVCPRTGQLRRWQGKRRR